MQLVWTGHEASREGQAEGQGDEEGWQEMSCFMPSPWTPRIPGAGWIAKERWQEEYEKRQEAAKRKPSSTTGKQSTPTVRSRLRQSAAAAADS